MRLLIGECEPAEAREARRALVGRSLGDTLAAALRHVAGADAATERAFPADPEAPEPDVEELAGYDAVFLTGSPIHVYDGSPEARSTIGFARAVFGSGTPCWGSCAGLQIAVVAAGGVVRSMQDRREAGITRRISATDAGRDHPMLKGRAPVWDAVTIHSDEVERLPDNSVLLARNGETEVQAAEIRMGPGVFWGTQYHPELPLDEIAAALRRDADDLVETGLARAPVEVKLQAALLDALARNPERRDLRWRLGVDAELADRERRTLELRNFVEHLVKPAMAVRGRV